MIRTGSSQGFPGFERAVFRVSDGFPRFGRAILRVSGGFHRFEWAVHVGSVDGVCRGRSQDDS